MKSNVEYSVEFENWTTGAITVDYFSSWRGAYRRLRRYGVCRDCIERKVTESNGEFVVFHHDDGSRHIYCFKLQA